MGLPSGVVTFVFTDIEGSTPLFERLGDGYRGLHERHRELLRAAFAGHGGREVGTEGDSFFVAFADASAAVAASIEAQAAMAAEPWPDGVSLRVRIGIHAGSAVPVDGNYTALAVHEAARVMAAGNGGQIVVSDVIERFASIAAGVEYIDTGMHHLRGLSQPMRLFRVQHPSMPDDSRPLRTTRVATSNLPVILDSLVGRADDVAEVTKLVASSRCVTVTGSGGVGKTRIAVQVASDLVDEFPDGTWFVDLHALRAGAEVAVALASTLQVEATGEGLGRVTTAIAASRTLLVFDNCEHLLGPVSGVVDVLLRACPNLAVLATSREALGVNGEVAWRLPSLGRDDAIRLLTDRVGRQRSTFDPTADDMASFGEIAHRLDGIPLALELAAARCSAMAPREVAARLHQRFRLLTGARGSLSRHQTLEAAVAWSHDLLDDETRTAFRRLAAFAGGWTLTDAEEVCGFGDLDGFAVADAVTALVDKSLVVADLDVMPARYRFLETVRQFAQAELVRAGEAEAVHDRHLAAFAAVIRWANRAIPGRDENAALRRTDADVDNVRAAFDWAESTSQPALLAAIAADFSDPGSSVGYADVAYDLIERALAAGNAAGGGVPIEEHIHLLVAAARLGEFHLLAAGKCRPRVEEAYQLVRELNDPWPILRSLTLFWTGRFRMFDGNVDGGLPLMEAAVAEAGRIGPAFEVMATTAFAVRLLDQDIDVDRGRALLDAARPTSRASGSTRAEAAVVTGLLLEAALRGDSAEGERLADELAAIAERLPAEAAAALIADAASHLLRAHCIDAAERHAARAVDLATLSGRSAAVARASLVAGEIAAARGDERAARRELYLARDVADRLSLMFVAMLARYRMAQVALRAGAINEALVLTDEAKPIAERLGSMPWVAWHLLRSRVELSRGDAAAVDLIREALPMARDLNSATALATALNGVALLLADAGQADDAARVLGLMRVTASESRLRYSGSVLHSRARDELRRKLRDNLGPDRYEQLQIEGEALSVSDIEALLELLR